MFTLVSKISRSVNSLSTGNVYALLALASFAFALQSCNSSEGAGYGAMPPPALPIIAVKTTPATVYQEFSASLEGKKDIEIRPQVNGYLEKIYVDEGAHVKKGQLLFLINDRPYREQLNAAKASLASAKASLVNAQINVSKLTPLVSANVVSDVQLKGAQAGYDVAASNVAQAQAMVTNAEISLGYAAIKAPVDGYIGRIPYKIGSLVGTTSVEALTLLSEVKEVYAYFSLSEKDFIQFRNQFPGATVEEKIKHFPPVELMLADNSLYPEKGKIEMVSGQFNHNIGSISFRAVFPNGGGLLRSGNTGTIRIPRSITNALAVPQEATFELQDKVLVFLVDTGNKVTSSPIQISGKSGNYYLVEKGLKEGDKIVFSGTDRLRDGAPIQPTLISIDSLIRVRPL